MNGEDIIGLVPWRRSSPRLAQAVVTERLKGLLRVYKSLALARGNSEHEDACRSALASD